jgi:hypothetical protein
MTSIWNWLRGTAGEISTPLDDAERRKQRSIAILKRDGVPVLATLPTVETEFTPRTIEEIATRAAALIIVAMRPDLGDQQTAQTIIDRLHLTGMFTPKEQEYLDDPDPPQHARVQFTWRFEALAVLLWALGHFETLGRPDKIIDASYPVNLLRELRLEGIIAKASPKAAPAILDELDLIYRYHWAAVDARLKGRDPPAGLDKGVVQERHYAFNWLVRYMDQAWDDISTDT